MLLLSLCKRKHGIVKTVMSYICASNVQTIKRRNVFLQNDIANYWPGMCNTAFSVVFMDQCERGYF